MKNWMIATGLLLLISISSMAQQRNRQERPDPETRAKMMTERMVEQLGLNEEQKAKILAINLENAQKREAKMAEQKAEREARRTQMQDQEKQIMEVLTEEQRQKWIELKETRKNRSPRGGMIHDREEFRKRRGGGIN
ncbi:DUF4890 domain-containing protein [Algoriphagus sp.]|uniref:DUF4890 domain-containing protein n=1 Tax=Algoriphagus sp. TaxID=1872435 RepID=UPI00261F6BB2|nr:DUF4890 domain-containing protein [Algoriphagus sp.]